MNLSKKILFLTLLLSSIVYGATLHNYEGVWKVPAKDSSSQDWYFGVDEEGKLFEVQVLNIPTKALTTNKTIKDSSLFILGSVNERALQINFKPELAELIYAKDQIKVAIQRVSEEQAKSMHKKAKELKEKLIGRYQLVEGGILSQYTNILKYKYNAYIDICREFGIDFNGEGFLSITVSTQDPLVAVRGHLGRQFRLRELDPKDTYAFDFIAESEIVDFHVKKTKSNCKVDK